MAIEDRIHAVVDPIVDDLGLELVDLVYGGGRLKVTLDATDGLDSDLLTKATRLISHELDLADPISGAYTLEVSTPGVERPLRTPPHFVRSIGEQVTIKLTAGTTDPDGNNLRRVKGELVAADTDTITVAAEDTEHVLAYDQIAKARTVFDWGPAPKPGKGKKQPNKTASTQPAQQAKKG